MWKHIAMEAPGFDRFWSAYLRREKKQAARDAYRWAMQNHNRDGELLGRMLDTLAWQAKRQPDAQFWPQPDKWLLGMRWEDENPAHEVQARAQIDAAAEAEYKAMRARAIAEQEARFKSEMGRG